MKQAGESFGWLYPLPIWAWVLLGVLALGVSVWGSRLPVPIWARITLTTLRMLLLLTMGVLLAGPARVMRHASVRPDVTVVLVDQSGSMGLMDMPGLDSWQSRNQVANTLLEEVMGHWPQAREMQVLAFADKAIWPFTQSVHRTPEGATDLAATFSRWRERIGQRPVSGVVLLSDGRSDSAPDLTDWPQEVPVHVVPLGQVEAMPGVSLTHLELPEIVFAGDPAPLDIQLHGTGLADVSRVQLTVRSGGPDAPPICQVRLSEALNLGEGRFRLQLKDQPVGTHDLQVSVALLDVQDAPQHEALLSDNTLPGRLTVVDQPLRVLVVEQSPRWEYRYLRTLLLREEKTAAAEGVQCALLLLDADRAFVPEGKLARSGFPLRMEDLAPFDVVVLGDVDPARLSETQQQLLADHVRDNGAGLLMLGGARHNPHRWARTPLAGALPMRDPAACQPAVLTDAAGVAPAAASLQWGLPVLTDPDTAQADRWPGWPQTGVSPLHFVLDPGALKPTAQVLLNWQTSSARGPLLTRMRWGAGTCLFVGSDDLFRWRARPEGRVHHQRLWLQMLRHLGRAHLAPDADATPAASAEWPVELRQQEADHALLEKLAAATGGRVLNRQDLRDLDKHLPDQSITTWYTSRQPLWHHGMVLALLILLMACEWSLRRALFHV